MARLTTQTGRQKVLNPNLGYDVEDGGLDLHETLTTMFGVFSDNITQKWIGAVTLQPLGSAGDDVTITHNFTTTVASLKLLFVIGGALQTEAQVLSKFTIANVAGNNAITVENKDAVNPVTFDCYVWAVKPSIVSSDLESAFLGTIATLTGTQTLTNKTLSGATLLEEASPATPAAGKVAMFAKNDKKLYLKDSDGTEMKVGSGGGSKNWVKNPDAESSVTADVTFGAGVVAPSLAPSALIGLKSFRVTGVATAGATTWWQWAVEAIDSFFIGKPMYFSVKTSASVASAFKVAVYNVTDSTEVATTAVTIPGGMFEAKGFFIPEASDTYAIRVTQLTNGTATCDLDDVYVGELPVRYGQAVTDWQTWTPTGSWTSNTTYTGQYRRVGDSIVCLVKAQLSGAPNAVSLTINIPSGLSIDTSKMLASVSHSIGVGTLLEAGVQNRTCTAAYTGSSNSISVMIQGSGGAYTNDISGISATNPHTWKSGDNIAVEFSVPIVGWSSNVQQADRALEEFASNSSQADVDDTTSFVYGINGSPLQGATLSANRTRRLRFQTKIQPSDMFSLEIFDGFGWSPLIGSCVVNGVDYVDGFTINTGAGMGMLARIPGSDTDISVVVGRYCRAPSQNWPAAFASTGRWRVRKVSGGAQVGFPISSANIVGTIPNSIIDYSSLLTTSAGIKAGGLFSIGVDYTFGDYSGVQGIKNPASMLILVAGNDVTGAGISALYLVNAKVQSGNASTSAIKIGGDAAVTATFTYVATDIFRVTYTGSGSVIKWRYLGGF